MKVVGKLLIGLSAFMLIISCSSSYEQKGNAAYNAAKKLSGDQKKLQLKTAYINYDKAVKAKETVVQRAEEAYKSAEEAANNGYNSAVAEAAKVREENIEKAWKVRDETIEQAWQIYSKIAK